MLLPLALLLSPAATAAPAWSWPAAPVRYHLDSRLVVPHGRGMYADANLDARAAELRLVADVTCLAEDTTPRLWTIDCTFDRLVLSGRGTDEGEDEALQVILAEWTTTLAGAHARFPQRRDGRVAGFELTGLSSATQRETRVREAQRQVVQRAFAPFDLELPPAGDDWIRGWTTELLGPAWHLPVGVGTAGIGSITFTPDRTPGELHEITYAGRATVAAGSSLDELTGEGEADEHRYGDATCWALLSGAVLFDPERGLPEWRGLRMEVHRNVPQAGVGDDDELLHLAVLRRVE